MGIVDGLARPSIGEFAKVPGALAFALGLVFLIVGRAELFSENFFDPAAAMFKFRRSGLVTLSHAAQARGAQERG